MKLVVNSKPPNNELEVKDMSWGKWYIVTKSSSVTSICVGEPVYRSSIGVLFFNKHGVSCSWENDHIEEYCPSVLRVRELVHGEEIKFIA